MYQIIKEFEKLNTQNRVDFMIEFMNCYARLINKKNNTENIKKRFRPQQEEVINDRIQPLQLQETRVMDPRERKVTKK